MPSSSSNSGGVEQYIYQNNMEPQRFRKAQLAGILIKVQCKLPKCKQ